MEGETYMKRIPIITRKPIMTSKRETIYLDEPDKMYPVYGFEGVYEMSITGDIRKISTGSPVTLYNGKNGKVVCLIHPKSSFGTLTASLSDVWSSTFLDDKALNSYSYMDSINKK